MKTYTVVCNCPTPLVENPFTVQAEDESQAQKLFFAHNGISGSDHSIEITEDEVVKAAPKKTNERSNNTSGNQK